MPQPLLHFCFTATHAGACSLRGSQGPGFGATMKNGRASASSSAGDVAKLIKAVFGEAPLPASLFTVDPEQDLKHEKLKELIADLIKLDAFVTLRILEKALVLQTNLMSRHEAGLIAKPIRNLLQYVRGKAKNCSTGTRLPAHIRKLVAIFKEQHPSQSPTKELDPGLASASKASSSTTSAPLAVATSILSKSKAEIEALFGLGSAQDVVTLSQDSVAEVPLTKEPAEVVDLLSQPETQIAPIQDYPAQPAQAPPELEHWDAGRATLVRTFRTGQQEVGEAFAGGDGFIHVRWASGEVTATEQSSLQLVLPCMRRPAAAMKRPAGMAENQPASEWEDEEQEEQTDEELHHAHEEQHQSEDKQEEETEKADDQELAEAAEESSTKKRKKEHSPPEPPSPFFFPDGSMMKLGVFTHKSYILYKKATSETKWPLLVGCEEKLAWKHEKEHGSVIKAVWCQLARLSAIPDKAEAVQIRDQVLRT